MQIIPLFSPLGKGKHGPEMTCVCVGGVDVVVCEDVALPTDFDDGAAECALEGAASLSVDLAGVTGTALAPTECVALLVLLPASEEGATGRAAATGWFEAPWPKQAAIRADL